MDEYLETARVYWTPARLLKLTAGKNLLLTPLDAPELLRKIGILNPDTSMSADAVSKFLQINHMAQLMLPYMKELASRFSPVKILDFGCGNSYLTFLLGWLFRSHLNHPAKLVGIDQNAKLIAQCNDRSSKLGWPELEFHVSKVEDAAKLLQDGRFNAVIALHACDTATDHALAFGILHKADFIAVAPCCQAELAQHWKSLSGPNLSHSLGVLMNTADLRRDSGSTFTDAIRLLLLRANGYEAQTGEFVSSAHTSKNRLIVAERRGNFQKSSYEEYLKFLNAVGNPKLTLSHLLDERHRVIFGM